MIALLLAFLTLPVGAQMLPSAVTDPSISEDLEYLSRQIRKNTNDINTANGATGRLSGNNTWTGTNTYNNQIVANSSFSWNGGLFGVIHASTYTRIPESSWTDTVMGRCVTSSSVTYVHPTAGRSVKITFSGSMYHTTSQDVFWAPLVDGSLPLGLSATTGVIIHTVPGGYCQNMGGSLVMAIASGSHTICLTAAQVNGTTTMVNGTTSCAGGSGSSMNQFIVEEWP